MTVLIAAIFLVNWNTIDSSKYNFNSIRPCLLWPKKIITELPHNLVKLTWFPNSLLLIIIYFNCVFWPNNFNCTIKFWLCDSFTIATLKKTSTFIWQLSSHYNSVNQSCFGMLLPSKIGYLMSDRLSNVKYPI